MRALIRGERNGTVGMVAGLLGVICLLIASIGLNLRHINDLSHLQNTIYQRCLDRAAFDQAANNARQAEIREWRYLASQESDPKAAAYTRLADAMQAAVDAQVRGGCGRYK